MKLGILPFLEKKEKPEYYLALVLRNEKATSVIFEKIGPTIKYISHGEEEFINTVEDAETEEFLEVLDKVITSAESALPENIETHKTIFGLKESWIENNKIKKEYLEKLKKACDELSLEPIGFLAFAESIINLIQKDEGAPVTAVLADIGKKFITVSLIKSGRIIETKSSEIHQSTTFTVDTLLKHFQTPEVMPSRVILLDSEEEELTQEFIGHQWSKSLPFLHLPQILSLPADASIKAMLLGAATQMGTKLLYDSTRIDMEQEETPKKINPGELLSTELIENPLEKKKEPVEIMNEQTPEYVDHDNSLEYFGFVQGQDIAKVPTPKKPVEQEKVPEEIVEETIDETPEEAKIEIEQKTGMPAIIGLVFVKAQKFSSLGFRSLQKIKLGPLSEKLKNVNFKNRAAIIIPAAVVALLLIAIFYLYSSRKAVVTILVNPKQDTKTTSVTFSSSSSTDISGGVLAGQTVSVSEDGTASTSTTGKKDIGTTAKGTVTIFNISTDGNLSLSSGTTITSPNELKFTLDSDVNVASASGDAISGINPATATVNVTASDIGQDYNLPSGTKFTVSGQDTSVAAKNDKAFSGGTKKTVTVVSKDDVQKLLTALPKQLESKAKTDIQTKATDGKLLLPQFISETVSGKNFDKNVGDQVSQLNLKGTVDFSTIAYDNSDLVSLANSLFNSGSIQLSKDSLSVNAKNIVAENNGDISADLEIKANLLPKIDAQNLANQIKSADIAKARNIISNFPQVENVGIVINPGIPFLPQNLPGNPKSITINIISK
jgi:hypothetical protein